VKLIWHSHYQGKVPHAQILCGYFWWNDVIKQVDNFRGVVVFSHGRGDTALFWSDNWEVNGSKLPMAKRYHMSFSFVLNDQMSMAEVYKTDDLSILFYLPLFTQAFQEFTMLQEIFHYNILLENNDTWKYCWGEEYAASSFYKKIHDHIQTPAVYKWLWKSCCIMKTKGFAWLMLSDRLNTRDMLQRRHWRVTNDTHCVLFPIRSYEDRIHLFFQCNFSVRI
jgi:hypothetical protein